MSEVVVRFVDDNSDDSACELRLIFLDGTTNLFLVIGRKLVAQFAEAYRTKRELILNFENTILGTSHSHYQPSLAVTRTCHPMFGNCCEFVREDVQKCRNFSRKVCYIVIVCKEVAEMLRPAEVGH
jgi:hypothetical protein